METERISLRPWMDSDAETLFKYASDPEVGPRAGWPTHQSVEESLEIIRTVFNAEGMWAVPGQMKLLFDRIVYGMMRDTPRFPEPLMKGKKCILLSTCTTPWPWNIWFKLSRGAIRAMREICRYSGFKIVATIERGGTAMHPQLSEKDIQKCHKAVRKIFE